MIVDDQTIERKQIVEGETASALFYEMIDHIDMENAVLSGDKSIMKMSFSVNVMSIKKRVADEIS